MDHGEYCGAVFSLNIFFLTYDLGREKEPDVFRIFDDWVRTTGFKITKKETAVEVMEYIKTAVNVPLHKHIKSAEIDLIPDYKDYLYLDKKRMF